jgi:hypothetical protein
VVTRRRLSPRFQSENFQKNVKLVEGLEKLARAKKSRGRNVVAIPARHRFTTEELVSPLAIGFTTNELARIDEVAPKGAAAGARYPEQAMKAVNR